jgi:hypothetical protein
MNLFWIAAFAILVLLEKVMPAGRIVGRLAGVVFIAASGWMPFTNMLKNSHPGGPWRQLSHSKSPYTLRTRTIANPRRAKCRGDLQTIFHTLT